MNLLDVLFSFLARDLNGCWGFVRGCVCMCGKGGVVGGGSGAPAPNCSGGL